MKQIIRVSYIPTPISPIEKEFLLLDKQLTFSFKQKLLHFLSNFDIELSDAIYSEFK